MSIGNIGNCLRPFNEIIIMILEHNENVIISTEQTH